MEQDAETPIGAVIDDRYRIVRLLESDELGDIYEAEQLRLGRTVSIKLLRSTRPEVIDRFMREALVLARLDHPSIVYVLDFGTYQGRPYLARDLVGGETLEHAIAACRIFAPEDALPLLIQIAEGLEHAHAAGIIHRHLSPSNIVLSPERRARIADFALARILVAEEDGRPGATVALWPYMAPEQSKGGAVDARADLYALGAIAYRMIAGRPVFDAPLLSEMLLMQRDGEPTPLAQAIKLTAEAASLARTVDKLLARDPDQRFTSATQTLLALRAAVHELALPDATADAMSYHSVAVASPLPARVPAPVVTPMLPPPFASERPTLPVISVKIEEPVSAPTISVAAPVHTPLTPLPPPSPPPSPPVHIGPPVSSFVEEPSLSHDLPRFFEPMSRASSGSFASAPSLASGTVRMPSTDPLEQTFAKSLMAAMPALATLASVVALAAAFMLFVIGPPDPARDARDAVRGGRAASVIMQIETILAKGRTDPELESALGYAFMQANNSKKALRHYAAAAAQDPESLLAPDVAALVSLLALPTDDSLQAEQALKQVPGAALPWLRVAHGSVGTDSYLRCRTGLLLRDLGERDIDPIPVCAETLAAKLCAPRALVIRRLAEAKDRRALPALEKLAAHRDRPVPAKECGTDEAYAALEQVRAKK